MQEGAETQESDGLEIPEDRRWPYSEAMEFKRYVCHSMLWLEKVLGDLGYGQHCHAGLSGQSVIAGVSLREPGKVLPCTKVLRSSWNRSFGVCWSPEMLNVNFW